MKLDYKDIEGVWLLSSWNSKLIGQKKNDENQPNAEIKVWDKNENYSQLFEHLFKRKILNEKDLSNYCIYFKPEKSNTANKVIEVFDHYNQEFLGELEYSYKDYYSKGNLEYSSKNAIIFADLRFVKIDNLTINETFERTIILGNSVKQNSNNKLEFHKNTDDQLQRLVIKIKEDVIEKERNKLSNFFFIDDDGNEVQLTNGEMEDRMLQNVKDSVGNENKDDQKNKWWEFWK